MIPWKLQTTHPVFLQLQQSPVLYCNVNCCINYNCVVLSLLLRHFVVQCVIFTSVVLSSTEKDALWNHNEDCAIRLQKDPVLEQIVDVI